MTDFTAYLRLGVDSRDAVSAKKDLDKMTEAGTKSEKSFSALGVASKALGGALAAMGAGKIAGDLISITRETGIMTASLRTATGSAESAAVAFDAITKLASQLPESVDSVATAFTKLVNYGLNPSEAAIKSYSNTAAALGKDLSQMVEAVADAATGEFERLKEFGIKSKVQGDQVSFAFRGVTETVKNSAAEIEGYLQDIGNNEFAGSAAEQMKELDGAISNLGDTYDSLLRTISKQGVGEFIGDSVRGASAALQELNDLIASGQLAAYIDVIVIKFSGAADSVRMAFELMAVYYDDFVLLFDGAGGFLLDAFVNLPENITAILKIATVEVAAFADTVGAYGDQIARNLNPITAVKDAIGGYEQLNTRLGAINQARMDSIETALAERDTAISSVDAQISKAAELRAKYDENNAAILAGGDALGQFQIKAEAAADAVSASEKKRAESVAASIAELEKQNALFGEQSKYADILYSIEAGLLKVTDAEKARYLAAAQTNDQLVANKNLADSIDSFAKKSEEDKAALDEWIKSIDEFGGAWTRTGSVISDALGGIGDALDDYSAKMASIAKEQETANENKKLFKGQQSELDKIAKAEKKLADERTKANLKSFGTIAGAASEMFDEQSKARRTLHGIEVAFNAVEMAMTIGRSLLAAKEAVLTQAKGDPYTAWARMAAMAAAVAAIGYAVGGIGGGGGGQSAAQIQESQGTGSVFGSNDKSESISTAFEEYADIGIEQLGELRMIREGLTGLTGGINKLSVGVITSGLTEAKYVNFANQYVGEILNSGMIKTRGTRSQDIAGREMLAPLQGQIASIFGYIEESVNAATGALEIAQNNPAWKFITDIGKVSFEGLSGEEIQSELNAIFSQQADLITEFVVPAMKEYQQIGEGLFETLTRVANEMATFNYYTDALGLNFNMTGLAAIAVQQSIAEFSGGMDKLSENLQSYYEEFFTEEERAANQMKLLAGELKNLGYDSVPTSREAFRALVEGIDLTTEAGQKQFAGLISLSGAFAELVEETEALANTSKSAADIAKERTDLETRLWQMTATAADVREKELAAIDGTNKSILEQIFALQDLQAAEKEAAAARLAVNNQLASLEKQYFDLTATEAEKRNALMQSLLSDESRAIQESIYAWHDAQSAAAEAAQAIEDAAAAMEQLKSAASSAFDVLRNSVDAERARIESIVSGANAAKGVLDSAIDAERSTIDKAHQDKISQLQSMADQERKNLEANANAQNQAQEALSKARIDSINQEKSAVEERIGGLKSLFDQLTSAADDVTPKTNASILAARRSAIFEIDTALRNAASGRGLPTDGRLDTALQSVRENPSELYANAREQAFDNDVVRNKLAELAGYTERQLTSEEMTLSILERQLESSQTAADNFVAFTAVSTTKYDDMIAAANAQYANDVAGLDLISKNAQAQIDKLTGIDSRQLSVEEALTAFNESLLAADFENAQEQYARLDGILEQGQLQLDTLLDIDSGVLSLRDAIDRFAAAVGAVDQTKVNEELIAEMKRTADEMAVMREDQRKYAFAQIKELQDINLYTRETAINSEPA